MGTNYYARISECKECGRFEEIHLGKSSYGWKFTFALNGRKYYATVEEMKDWLRGKTIKDEYDREITQKEFWDMVAEKQKVENPSHDSHDIWIKGYHFVDGEFC